MKLSTIMLIIGSFLYLLIIPACHKQNPEPGPATTFRKPDPKSEISKDFKPKESLKNKNKEPQPDDAISDTHEESN